MVAVRPLRREDRERWGELFAGYARFYEVKPDGERDERVFAWLLDPAHELEALVAVDDADAPVAFAHVREYADALLGGRALYLDDLYTDPDARGTGAGTALLGAVRALAKERGIGVIRWITADDNATAQSLYDRFAHRTSWVTYEMGVS